MFVQRLETRATIWLQIAKAKDQPRTSNLVRNMGTGDELCGARITLNPLVRVWRSWGPQQPSCTSSRAFFKALHPTASFPSTQGWPISADFVIKEAAVPQTNANCYYNDFDSPHPIQIGFMWKAMGYSGGFCSCSLGFTYSNPQIDTKVKYPTKIVVNLIVSNVPIFLGVAIS